MNVEKHCLKKHFFLYLGIYVFAHVCMHVQYTLCIPANVPFVGNKVFCINRMCSAEHT